jgi:hypothetical protein
MPQTVPIKVADLELDTQNPRLDGGHPSQPATALALAKKQERELLAFAEDVLHRGLDPLNNIAVVAKNGQPRRYTVIEGNRRVLAVKAMETPALVAPALSPAKQRKLNKLAEAYAANPIVDIECVLFDSEDEAQDWIERRHTGKNGGLGLSEWGSDEKDRYKMRRTGKRSPEGQILDFVLAQGLLSEEAEGSDVGIQTNVKRLLTNPGDRKRLGIDVKKGVVQALYPADEIAKSLTHIVEELKMQRLSVAQLYHAPDRKRFVSSLPTSVLPDPKTRLPSPVPLDEAPVSPSGRKRRKAARRKKSTTTPPAPRLTVIPSGTHFDIDQPRINQIFGELQTLNASNYPNGCAVLLRVFLELTVDHVVEGQNLMSDQELRERPPLAKKLKVVAKHLRDEQRIPAKLVTAINKIANGKLLGPSVFTFHQYVHNQYVFPRGDELFSAWDELAPFIREIWASPTTEGT